MSMKKKKSVVGILAHVDAGKTTFAEALLYKTGKLRSLGRVDKGDTAMDTHTLEKERGITIFSSQAVFSTENSEITLLDTPGHVDFSSETERTLQVLDYGVLVISGLDGVQSHTKTIWKLLKLYNIPTFIFVTKMDFARRTREELLSCLCRELDENCMDFTSDKGEEFFEGIAQCSEDALEKYLETGSVDEKDIALMIRSRKVFPCMFGSGLKAEGIDEFLSMLDKYTVAVNYPNAFGAKVYKVSHDKNGNRLTHMKITGGSLKVRDMVDIGDNREKISGIRIYTGEKFVTRDEVYAGEICAVTGLSNTKNGDGLGYEMQSEDPFLEPVMNYRVILPEDCDPDTMYQRLKILEEEDPQLNVTWNSFLREIRVGLMGEVQSEILKSLIYEKFGVEAELDRGTVMYRETIESLTEGVGHYEPLKHYAEVHLILEPLPRGRGLVFETKCSENSLDRNWQRLILSHLQEKQHLGVLTGSPVTDMKITLAAGRAHLKHTEGGDFRQATYRAVRQGLMKAKSRLLEPYYNFRLEIPFEQLGRAINDIRQMSGEFSSPESCGNTAVITGKAPVITMNGYAAAVASYTGGEGRLFTENGGYDLCHNEKEVTESFSYDPEGDTENSPDSVFCAHGAGFIVKWNEVGEYMHLESCLEKSMPYEPGTNTRNFHIDDKELQQIMEREFGKVKYELYRPASAKVEKEREEAPAYEREKYLIVDGYNVIFAWDELKKTADDSLQKAREILMNIMSNYSAFTNIKVVLVFDAYRVPGNTGRKFDFNNIHVVYTKENELGDVYIEKLISEIGKNSFVRVVTSDRLIQLSAVRAGVLRVSAVEFGKEIDEVNGEIRNILRSLKEE